MANAADDNAQEKAHWHWRNTMMPVRFFNLDARAGIPFCLLLLRLTSIPLWTLALGNLFMFRYLERKGLTFPAALRTLRGKITGLDRPAWVSLRRRVLKDFG